MREKEIETDYRFMPEPNLPPVHIKQHWVDDCRAALRKPRYLKNIEERGIEPHVALQIAVSFSVFPGTFQHFFVYLFVFKNA